MWVDLKNKWVRRIHIIDPMRYEVIVMMYINAVLLVMLTILRDVS